MDEVECILIYEKGADNKLMIQTNPIKNTNSKMEQRHTRDGSGA